MKNPHERGGVAAEAQLHGPDSFAPGPNRFAVLAADGDDGSAKAHRVLAGPPRSSCSVSRACSGRHSPPAVGALR